MKTETQEIKVSLNSLYKEHQQWHRSIALLKDEMKWLDERLIEVSSKNNSPDFVQWLESFQNQFIMLHEQLDILSHNISESLKRVEAVVKLNPHHINEKSQHDCDKLRNEVEIREQLFFEMKHKFNRFLATYM